VLVKAELSEGQQDQVLKIEFEYRLPSKSGMWQAIPAAIPNSPNPDYTYPWFVHWDVSGLPEDFCDIRAVAYNGYGMPDPDPAFITVKIDHHQPSPIEAFAPENTSVSDWYLYEH
jgi:hypothetical protein